MSESIKIVMAQLNFLVGDIEANLKKIIHHLRQARDELKADLVVFPELALSGYPPEDLLLRPEMYSRVKAALETLCSEVQGIEVIVGYPWSDNNTQRYNALAHIRNQKIVLQYFKRHLPNYSVFDEERYFIPGKQSCLTQIKNFPIALSICEDLWFSDVMADAKKAQAKLMISINASPFDLHKPQVREKLMADRAREGQMPVIYVNTVGGQDELVFDGGSMALSAEGKIQHRAPFYDEKLALVEVKANNNALEICSAEISAPMSFEARIYNALVLGLRDYITKNGFKSVVIGLSGGIDSALTLALTVDAIGAENVEALLMPSRYTSELSIQGAEEEAKLLGVKIHTISIESTVETILSSLAEEFKDQPLDVTEENIQARARGIILMAVSNKSGAMVVSTGNKSELSVGYCTLYGDMVGGFAVIKDVPKTMVYRLAHYRNSLGPVIPEAVIDRPPTAELAANQLDSDSLPPYEILDAILELSIEQEETPANIIAKGYDPATVQKVIKMIDRNEYKRRQAPVGVRISQKAFGRDRRYPITSGFNREKE